MNILFVCRANVGRSQMADAFFKKYSKINESKSAGIEVHAHEGELIGRNEKAMFVWKVMDEEHIDVRKNKRSQIYPRMIERADRVYVMADKSLWPLCMVDAPNVHFWDIPDAKGADYEAHKNVRDEIKVKIIELVNEIG